MIRVPLQYGEAWVEDNPSWAAVAGFLAARRHAFESAAPEEMVPEVVRLFVHHWTMTDANGTALEFPRDIGRLYFLDARDLSQAVADVLVKQGIVAQAEEGEPAQAPANPTLGPLSDSMASAISLMPTGPSEPPS